MLNNQQIKLLQTAVRAAGIRGKGFEGRYRMLLSQYRRPDGKPVTTCKDFNNSQLEDMLAICETHGWRMPGKAANHFQFLVGTRGEGASFAQQAAIQYLAGDLGLSEPELSKFLKRMTGGFVTNVVALRAGQAYKIIEALKAILSRHTGQEYDNLKDVQEDMEVNSEQACQV